MMIDELTQDINMQDTLENRLAATQYIVEATSFEKHSLWKHYVYDKEQVKWTQHSGYLPTVGLLGDKPTCISALWDTIDGVSILFWHDTSAVVDFSLIDAYFEKYCKDVPRCDANNFHQCINFINEVNNK